MIKIEIDQIIDKLEEYKKWWSLQIEPYRNVALGELSHTGQRLELLKKQKVLDGRS